MLKTIKIFLLILGLGTFVLPTQTLFAKQIENCCAMNSPQENCCGNNKNESCQDQDTHTGKETSDHCGNNCANCHSCILHLVFNQNSCDELKSSSIIVELKKQNFGHGIPYFSSDFQNIWQPPKIA
ncbi:MAG: hypothetical protein BGO40_13030 [Chryseobacterium sp. 39-10]|nr:MAG: hypothetical protein BGO40_13030 [Chryseobacterium sp. 39-10]